MRPCASRVLVERNKTLDANISERRRVYRGSNRNLEREREVFKEKEKRRVRRVLGKKETQWKVGKG